MKLQTVWKIYRSLIFSQNAERFFNLPFPKRIHNFTNALMGLKVFENVKIIKVFYLFID